MDISDLPALIAAVAFAILVLLLALPLIKLGSVFDELRQAIKRTTDESINAVQMVNETMGQVGQQMEKVDEITSAANRSVQDISALTTLVSATLGRPLIKVSAFSYAVRKALNLEGKQEK